MKWNHNKILTEWHVTPELQDSASLRFLSYSGIIYEKAGHNSMQKHTPFDTLCWVQYEMDVESVCHIFFAKDGVKLHRTCYVGVTKWASTYGCSNNTGGGEGGWGCDWRHHR